MLLIANCKNLKKHALSLCNGDKELLKKVIDLCEAPIRKQPGKHVSHAVRKRLDEIDSLIGGFGVESVFEWRTGGSVDATNYRPEEVIDIQYVNQGGTFSTTILYWRGRLRIGDWGTIVKRLSK